MPDPTACPVVYPAYSQPILNLGFVSPRVSLTRLPRPLVPFRGLLLLLSSLLLVDTSRYIYLAALPDSAALAHIIMLTSAPPGVAHFMLQSLTTLVICSADICSPDIYS